jgi:hypothetical protein
MSAGAVTLGRREAVAGRPFTSPSESAHDLSVLGVILRGIRDALVHAPVEDLVPYQRVVWRVGDLNHRLIMCDRERLVSHPGPCVVGFFGQRRTGTDITPLEDANTAIVAEFTKYPGILSYSSMELAEGNWANMVMHDDPVDTEYWRRSALHVQAVRLLSPKYYHSVRIHNARLSEPLLDDPEIVLLRTKYYAFDGDDVWRAERPLV